MDDEADVAAGTALASVFTPGGLSAEVGSVGERQQIVGERRFVALVCFLVRAPVGSGGREQARQDNREKFFNRYH